MITAFAGIWGEFGRELREMAVRERSGGDFGGSWGWGVMGLG